MGKRGATRPMTLHTGGHDHGPPYSDSRYHMLRMHHSHTLWIYWLLVMLGIWLVVFPLTFSYAKGAVPPSGGRELYLSLAGRIWAMTLSDIIAGLLLIVFGYRALKPDRPVSLWICCFIGIWLTFAPVLFWAPTAAGYLNSTIVGAMVIMLTIIIPGMPNMPLYMQMGGDTPPGWSYNPSSWTQRSILIALAFAGWLVSRYLAAYQMGYIDHAWDPIFGQGSRRVLDSNMSHMWPVSDAAFGAVAYTFEFIMALMGSSSRWRTMPWMVTIFGILVIPLGLTHILLVISQPVVVEAWCTFCLLAALIMLPMIPLEVDEVVAMGQHMGKGKAHGDSLWTTFWKGSTPADAEPDQHTPAIDSFPDQPGRVLTASIWGMSFPWPLVAATILGLYVMFGPILFTIERPAANAHFVGGALIMTTAVCAMGEPIRVLRWLNVPLALAIIVLPWWLAGDNWAGRLNAFVVGLLVIALSIPRGRICERYAGWDHGIR